MGSALGLCFLREVCQKRGLNRPLVAKAKTKLKTTSKMSPRRQAIYLTAVLVSEAYKDWYKLDLQDPLSDPDFEPENFYRVYIGPHLATIRATIKNKPRMLIPLHNAYLNSVIPDRLYRSRY